MTDGRDGAPAGARLAPRTVPWAAVAVWLLGAALLVASAVGGSVSPGVLPGWFFLAPLPGGVLAALVAACDRRMPTDRRMPWAAGLLATGFVLVGVAWAVVVVVSGP